MNTVVSQALATGLPVVTTRHSGLPEQVLDGVNGFLVDEGDYVALAERILRIAEYPELLPAMSAASRDHVRRHYDLSALTERQIAAYEELRRGVPLPDRHLHAARVDGPTAGERSTPTDPA